MTCTPSELCLWMFLQVASHRQLDCILGTLYNYIFYDFVIFPQVLPSVVAVDNVESVARNLVELVLYTASQVRSEKLVLPTELNTTTKITPPYVAVMEITIAICEPSTYRLLAIFF